MAYKNETLRSTDATRGWVIQTANAVPLYEQESNKLAEYISLLEKTLQWLTGVKGSLRQSSDPNQ